MTVQTTKTTTRAAPLPAPLHTPVSAPPAPFASPSFSPSPVVAPLPPQRPAPEGPPGTLVIESAYPVTVSSGGRVLATEKTVASLTMTAGSHEILIESAAVFLKRRETVQLEAGGSFTLRPPGTGKISVRASPDNCKVFIDGVFVDYPPILDHPITSGPHLVGFEWPDGAKAEQKIPVRNGETARVIGKKP